MWAHIATSKFNSTLGPSTKTMFEGSNQQLNATKRENEKLRLMNHLVGIFMELVGRFIKLLEVKVHYHEIEVCHV